MSCDPRHDRDEPRPDDELPGGFLDELRAAWRDVPTPPATPPLADTEAGTQQVVAWMAAAWAALPAAQADPPLAAHARQRRQRRWLSLQWTRQLAAAALLVGMAFALWLVRADRLARPGAVDVVADIPAASTPGDPIDAPSPAPDTAAPAPLVPGGALVSASKDHLELRSGNVRLLLCTTLITPESRPR